jgi:hypothetical protein
MVNLGATRVAQTLQALIGPLHLIFHSPDFLLDAEALTRKEISQRGLRNLVRTIKIIPLYIYHALKFIFSITCIFSGLREKRPFPGRLETQTGRNQRRELELDLEHGKALVLDVVRLAMPRKASPLTVITRTS